MGERLADVWARVASRPGALALPDLYGRPVPTLPHLVAFRDRLLDRIAASGVRVVNATGGGILHGRGLEIASLDDVLAGASPVGDLRARIHERRVRSVSRSDAAALDAALARLDTADALTALVPGVDSARMVTAIAQARSTMAGRSTHKPVAVVPQTTADSPVWLPEQTAALAALAVPGAADRAPLLDPVVETVTWASVVDAARNLLAHDPLVAGAVDADALIGNFLALPLQLLLPLTPGARQAGERFGAALTRWIATHPPDPMADASFWSTPLASIDPPADSGAVPRPPDDMARAATITTLAWVAARTRGR